MSLAVFISLRAEQDMTLQYRWYLENADREVAERFLLAVHETIQSVAGLPDLGLRRHFRAPELARIRSIQINRPFNRHLLFYVEGEDPARRARHARCARSSPQIIGRPRRRPEPMSEWLKRILESKRVMPNPETGGWRAFFKLDIPDKTSHLELSCELKQDTRAISERWM